MTAAKEMTAVRSFIAAQTRAVHEELHQNPVLKRLTAPDITRREYIAALRVLSIFYNTVERERGRLNVWGEFTLKAECSALGCDLLGQKAPSAELVFADKFELFGGLYVAHGASFGRNLFRQNLKGALRDVPQLFVSQRVNKAIWRLLTEKMETYGQDKKRLDALLSGASKSFQTVVMASQAFH